MWINKIFLGIVFPKNAEKEDFFEQGKFVFRQKGEQLGKKYRLFLCRKYIQRGDVFSSLVSRENKKWIKRWEMSEKFSEKFLVLLGTVYVEENGRKCEDSVKKKGKEKNMSKG